MRLRVFIGAIRPDLSTFVSRESFRVNGGSDLLRHDNAVALNPGFERTGRVELRSPVFDVAESAINRHQLGPQTQNVDIHGFTTLTAQMILGCSNKPAA
jgi:hypothetical protein